MATGDGTYSYDPSEPGSRSAMELRQRIALQLMGGGTKKGYPKNIGEGLASIGDSIGDVAMMRMLDKQIQDQNAATKAKSGELLDGPSAAATGPRADLGGPPAEMPVETGAVPAAAAPVASMPVAAPRVAVEPIPDIVRTNPDGSIAGNTTAPTIPTAPPTRSVTAAPAPAPSPYEMRPGEPYSINGLPGDPALADALRQRAMPPPASASGAGPDGRRSDAGDAIYPATASLDASSGTLPVGQGAPQRDAIARLLTGGSDALGGLGGPQANPTPSAVTPPTIPSPLASIQAGSPARAANNPPIVASDITAAPAPVPGAQMAQVFPSRQAPAPAPSPTPSPYVMEDPGPEPRAPVRDTRLNPRELQARPYLSADVDPAIKATAQRVMQEEQDKKNAAYDAQLKDYELKKTQWSQDKKDYQDWQANRQTKELELQKGRQGLIPQVPPGTADPRLGTIQSPQRTGIPVTPPVPPGVTPSEWSAQQAPKMAAAVDAYEKAYPQFNEAIKTLKLAQNHPGRDYGIGPTSDIARRFPGTSAYGFGTIMDQIGGKNFLNAYQQLRGGGSITEVEGSKAQAAQARLATAQNQTDFDKAMNDFETALRTDLETVQRKVNRPVTAWQRNPNDVYAPDVGERRGDKEYLGGNPRDPMSWRRVQ